MKKNVCNKGFSLIEVLLAVVLLALIATPVLQLFLSSMRTNKRSREVMCANEIAKESMEFIEAGDFENDIEPKFTASGTSVRFPGLSYSATNESSIQSMYDSTSYSSPDDFVTKAKATHVSVGGTVTYHASWDKDGVGYFGVVFYNLRAKYEGNDEAYYDEIIIFKENKESTSDKYFIYDVTSTVYSVENKANDDGSVSVSRFKDKMSVMNGSIVNSRL